MDKHTLSALLKGGFVLLSEVVRALPQNQPKKTVFLPKTTRVMPSTEDTVKTLRNRLAKELYRMELDLLGGGRIGGVPCDCLSYKHSFGIEAAAEELMAMDDSPVYRQVIEWLDQHKDEFEPDEIEKREPAYYQGLVPEFRRFRKKVVGTE